MKRRSKLVRARKRRDICMIHEQIREMLPFDLVIEILTKLPAKSLMRFKSVSKPWSSLICSQYFFFFAKQICSQYFTNRFQKAPSSSPRLYMYLDLDEKGVLLSASSSPHLDNGTTKSSFVIDQDLTISGPKGYISQLFCGLMCFVNGASAQIYNTTTRQLFLLPHIEESNIIAEDYKIKKIMYHIGHDPFHDRYKVFCTTSRRSDEVGEHITFLSEHWVLLLGGDGSSRRRNISSPCPPHLPLTQGLTINGRMHYLAWVRLLDLVLVSFDMSSEEINILQVREHVLPPHDNLLVYRGRVAVLRNNLKDEGVMELWVMEDAEEKNRWWSKTLVLDESQMHIVKMHLVNNIDLRVQGTTRNGEIILVPQNTTYYPTGIIYGPQDTSLFYVFLYNIQANHIRKVEIKTKSDRYLTNNWDIVGFDDIENLIYL